MQTRDRTLSSQLQTLAKEVQLFVGLGLFFGIFTMYLQCPSKRSGTARQTAKKRMSHSFLCCLSSIRFIYCYLCRWFAVIRISIIQATANGCCDFLAQCILVCISHCTCHPLYWPKSSKIYRFWIVWGQDIRVVIIPSFLSIAYLGQ